MTPITKRRRSPRRNGYSIAAILLLMAIIAVLLGSARSLGGGSLSAAAIVNMVVALLGGAIVGGMIGISHENRAGGLLVGVCVGGLTGLAAGAVIMAPEAGIAIPLIGSVAILSFGVLVRATSGPADRLDDCESAPAPGFGVWLKSMSLGQRLSFLLGGLTGVYVVVQGVELARSQVYYSAPQLVGRVVMMVLLSLLTCFLIWLALRKQPASRDDAIELTPIDIEPPLQREALSRQEPGERS